MDTIRTFCLHHLPWVLIVGALVIGGHLWQQEHDQRLISDQKVAADEQQVKTLQTSIQQNIAIEAQLQASMAQRDAQNAVVIQQLLKQKQQAVTPVQQIAALQTDIKLPVPITSIPGTESWTLPGADIQPLFSAVSDGLVAVAGLTTCQSDLTDEKTIAATNLDNFNKQVAITGQKDDEIKQLKKPKSFWHRVVGTLKDFGIGVGVGLALGHKF